MIHRINIYNSGMKNILFAFKYLLPTILSPVDKCHFTKALRWPYIIRNTTKSDCIVVTFSYE